MGGLQRKPLIYESDEESEFFGFESPTLLSPIVGEPDDMDIHCMLYGGGGGGDVGISAAPLVPVQHKTEEPGGTETQELGFVGANGAVVGDAPVNIVSPLSQNDTSTYDDTDDDGGAAPLEIASSPSGGSGDETLKNMVIERQSPNLTRLHELQNYRVPAFDQNSSSDKCLTETTSEFPKSSNSYHNYPQNNKTKLRKNTLHDDSFEEELYRFSLEYPAMPCEQKVLLWHTPEDLSDVEDVKDFEEIFELHEEFKNSSEATETVATYESSGGVSETLKPCYRNFGEFKQMLMKKFPFNEREDGKVAAPSSRKPMTATEYIQQQRELNSTSTSVHPARHTKLVHLNADSCTSESDLELISPLKRFHPQAGKPQCAKLSRSSGTCVKYSDLATENAKLKLALDEAMCANNLGPGREIIKPVFEAPVLQNTLCQQEIDSIESNNFKQIGIDFEPETKRRLLTKNAREALKAPSSTITSENLRTLTTTATTSKLTPEPSPLPAANMSKTTQVAKQTNRKLNTYKKREQELFRQWQSLNLPITSEEFEQVGNSSAKRNDETNPKREFCSYLGLSTTDDLLKNAIIESKRSLHRRSLRVRNIQEKQPAMKGKKNQKSKTMDGGSAEKGESVGIDNKNEKNAGDESDDEEDLPLNALIIKHKLQKVADEDEESKMNSGSLFSGNAQESRTRISRTPSTPVYEPLSRSRSRSSMRSNMAQPLCEIADGEIKIVCHLNSETKEDCLDKVSTTSGEKVVGSFEHGHTLLEKHNHTTKQLEETQILNLSETLTSSEFNGFLPYSPERPVRPPMIIDKPLTSARVERPLCNNYGESSNHSLQTSPKKFETDMCELQNYSSHIARLQEFQKCLEASRQHKPEIFIVQTLCKDFSANTLTQLENKERMDEKAGKEKGEIHFRQEAQQPLIPRNNDNKKHGHSAQGTTPKTIQFQHAGSSKSAPYQISHYKSHKKTKKHRKTSTSATKKPAQTNGLVNKVLHQPQPLQLSHRRKPKHSFLTRSICNMSNQRQLRNRKVLTEKFFPSPPPTPKKKSVKRTATTTDTASTSYSQEKKEAKASSKREPPKKKARRSKTPNYLRSNSSTSSDMSSSLSSNVEYFRASQASGPLQQQEQLDPTSAANSQQNARLSETYLQTVATNTDRSQEDVLCDVSTGDIADAVISTTTHITDNNNTRIKLISVGTSTEDLEELTAPPPTVPATNEQSTQLNPVECAHRWNVAPKRMLQNPLSKLHGRVLHIYYEKDLLIVVQELLVSFWKYSKLVNALSLSLNPTQPSEQWWVHQGEVKRQRGGVSNESTDMEINTPYKNRICYVNEKPTYMEVRCRLLNDAFRQCSMISLYVNMYYCNEEKPAAEMSSLQLDSVKCVPGDVVYTTLKESYYMIVAWAEETSTGKKRTGLVKYGFGPPHDTLTSLREFKSLRHEIRHLECTAYDRLLGFGLNELTVWDSRSGDVLMNFDLEIPIGRNLGSIYYNGLDIGHDHVVLLAQYLPNAIDDSDRPQLTVIACTISPEEPSYRLLWRHDLPDPAFRDIVGSTNTKEHLILTAGNGEEVWISCNDPHMVICLPATQTRRFYTRDCPQLIEMTDETLVVDTCCNYVLRVAAGAYTSTQNLT